LKIVRAAMGWKQSRLLVALEAAAHKLGVDVAPRTSLKTMVSKWENGAPMSAEYRRLFCEVYGMTEADLGFHETDSPPNLAPVPPTLDNLDAWQLADALTRSSIALPTLAEMEQAVYGYARRYPNAPPAELLPPVTRQMTRMRLVISEPQPLDVRRRSVALLGILSGVAGQLALDLGRHDQADAMFRVGQLAAHESDDHDLAAWIAATQSIGPFYAGRITTAADLLTHAEHQAARASSPRRRAWIAALHARALAAAGQHHAALAALDRAHSYLATTADPPSGTDFFDQHRLAGLAGECHLLLREPEPAADLLGQALARRVPSDAKGRALLTLDLAACRIIENERDGATQLVSAALDLAHGALVRPILDRARTIRADMAGWTRARRSPTWTPGSPRPGDRRAGGPGRDALDSPRPARHVRKRLGQRLPR
jgi:transcriptional regulator with XRE-family HTH domain